MTIIDNIVEYIDEFLNYRDFNSMYDKYKSDLGLFNTSGNDYATVINIDEIKEDKTDSVKDVEKPASRDDDKVAFACKKMFWDKMTEMVSSEVCFVDNNQLHISRFQYMVNEIYNRTIKRYIEEKKAKGSKLQEQDILFLYKGGTTMKILYDKYKNDMSQYSEFSLFFENVNKYFARSDSDYGMYINPNITQNTHGIDYNVVYVDVNIMSYVNLTIIRGVILSKNNEIVPLNLLTRDILVAKIDVLDNLLRDMKNNNKECDKFAHIDKIIGIGFEDNTYMKEEIPNITFNDVDEKIRKKNKKFIKFANNRKVETRMKDSVMTYKNHDITNRYYKEINDQHNIYITINETNEYVSGATLIAFSLHRAKINFIVYYKTNNNQYGFFNAPSELIDVSITKKNDTGIYKFYEHYNLEQKKYKYIYKNPTDASEILVRYRGYTVYGLVNDLIKVLMSALPWNDPKYIKRIKRMFVFMVFEICKVYNDDFDLVKLIIGHMYDFFNNAEMNVDKARKLGLLLSKLYNGNKMYYHQFFGEVAKMLDSEAFKNDAINIDKYKIMCNEIKETLCDVCDIKAIKMNNIDIDNKNEEQVYMLGGLGK